MHLMYESAYVLLYLHTYTGDMLKEWPTLINSGNLIGQLIMYVLDIYNSHTSKFFQTYYHYKGSKAV